jgi:predicted extracellular nuclease
MYAQGMLDKHVRPVWNVAHDYCQGCPGTYYYAPDDNWSFLDMILFSPARSEKTTWQIRADSVQILNRFPAQVTPDGRPNSYKASDRTGVSDHWPIVATIELIEKQ